MESNVINLENYRRVKYRISQVEKKKKIQSLSIPLGKVSFNVEMVIDSNIVYNDFIVIEPYRLAVMHDIQISNKLMTKNVFIQFCKFISKSISGTIDYKINEIEKSNITKVESTSNSILKINSILTFNLSLYKEESKMVLAPSIDWDNSLNLPENLFVAYCDAIKCYVPKYIDDFIQKIES